MVLTKLSSGTTYQFVVGSTDPSRNGPALSKQAVGSTSVEVDVTPPKIVGDAEVSYKSDNQAVINWETDEPGSSVVEFGTEGALDLVQTIPDPVKEHRVVLTNLFADSTYTFRAGTIDVSNNGPTWSATDTFRTDPTPDTTPPEIEDDPEVSAITDQTAIVTWHTDEASDSGVEYGTSSSALDFNAGSAEALEEHRVVLTKLTASTPYFLRVSSVDRVGNGPAVKPSGGGTVSFTTEAAPDTIAPAAVQSLLGRAGSGSALLSWQANTEADLTGYNLYRATGTDPLSLIASNLVEATFRDEGLTDEVAYRYSVTALDGSGNEGSFSEEATVTPSGENIPTAPVFQESRGEPLTPIFVVKNATSSGGTPLTYTFQVSTQEGFSDLVDSATEVPDGNESAGAGLTAWTVTVELTDGATYYLRVRANDGAFDGPFMTAQEIEVDATPIVRLGDFNNDFVVGLDDFFQFAVEFGQDAIGEKAVLDLSGNGKVDLDDFFTFAGLFGTEYENPGGSKPAVASSIRTDPSVRATFKAVSGFPAMGEEFTASINLEGADGLKGYGVRIEFDPDRLLLMGVEQLEGELAHVIRLGANEVVVLNFGEGIVGRVTDPEREGEVRLANLRFRVTGPSREAPAQVSDLIVLDGQDQLRTPEAHGFARLTLVPDQVVMLHNYPNPFNPVTTIRFGIPEEARTSIMVYNILGQQVAVLVDQIQPAGYYTAAWDGRDSQGRRMGSGVYLYRIKVGKVAVVKKMLLLK